MIYNKFLEVWVNVNQIQDYSKLTNLISKANLVFKIDEKK